jgi:hypothetical protein
MCHTDATKVLETPKPRKKQKTSSALHAPMLAGIDRPSLFIYAFEKGHIGKGDETHAVTFFLQKIQFLSRIR